MPRKFFCRRANVPPKYIYHITTCPDKWKYTSKRKASLAMFLMSSIQQVEVQQKRQETEARMAAVVDAQHQATHSQELAMVLSLSLALSFARVFSLPLSFSLLFTLSLSLSHAHNLYV